MSCSTKKPMFPPVCPHCGAPQRRVLDKRPDVEYVFIEFECLNSWMLLGRWVEENGHTEYRYLEVHGVCERADGGILIPKGPERYRGLYIPSHLSEDE